MTSSKTIIIIFLSTLTLSTACRTQVKVKEEDKLFHAGPVNSGFGVIYFGLYKKNKYHRYKDMDSSYWQWKYPDHKDEWEGMRQRDSWNTGHEHQIKIKTVHFTQVVPSIFYADIRIGVKTFVDCLEFTMGHDERQTDNPFCVVNKDGLSIMLFQNAEYADKEHPEIRLVTGNIDEVYAKVASKFPELLHPNLKEVALRPWGAREFAMLDGQIGIRVQQWQNRVK